MINQFRNCFLITVFLLSLICSSGISQGFDGSLVLGFNAAQLDGDKLAGFNKLGLTGGIRVSYPIKQKMDLGLELVFSQRGSKTPRGADVAEFVNLNYFAIPLFLNFKDWYIESEKYYKVRVEGGFTPAYLMGISSTFHSDQQIANFKDWDFSLHLGVGYQFNKRLGLTARYSRSPIKIYQFEDSANQVFNSLLSYFWTFRFDYLLN